MGSQDFPERTRGQRPRSRHALPCSLPARVAFLIATPQCRARGCIRPFAPYATTAHTPRRRHHRRPRAPDRVPGEVGIDRAARIPFAADVGDESDGGIDGRLLSPFSTPFAHQLSILEAQLALAVELCRNISLHSVKAPAQTRELFDRMAAVHGAAWFAISVDVHSCTLSPEMWWGIEVRPFHPLSPNSVACTSPTPEARGGTSTNG